MLMPMLAEIGTCLLSIHSGDASASVMLEATSEARAGSQLGSTMTNSSPLRRPSRSDGWMRAQPFGKFNQQRVAGRVSERIVDVLEVIEIEKQQRELFAPAIVDRLVDQLAQLRTVRQPGQHVMIGKPGDLGAGLLALDRQRAEVNAGLDDPLMPAARRPGLPEIEGKGPDHTAVLGLDRRRPAGLQADL